MKTITNLESVKAFVESHKFEAWIDAREQAVGFDIPYVDRNGHYGCDQQLVRTHEEARIALGY